MLRRDESGWSNPKVLTIFVVIFLCGAGFGSVVTREVLHSKLSGSANVSSIENVRRFGLKGLKRELNLTPDQEKIVARELDEYAKYYQNIEDQRADVAENGKQRIIYVLNEDQKKIFYRLFGEPKRPF